MKLVKKAMTPQTAPLASKAMAPQLEGPREASATKMKAMAPLRPGSAGAAIGPPIPAADIPEFIKMREMLQGADEKTLGACTDHTAHS